MPCSHELIERKWGLSDWSASVSLASFSISSAVLCEVLCFLCGSSHLRSINRRGTNRGLHRGRREWTAGRCIVDAYILGLTECCVTPPSRYRGRRAGDEPSTENSDC